MKRLFIIVWIVCTGILVKINLEYANNVKFYQQRIKELNNDKEYWEEKYGQTLENRLEAPLERDLKVKDREIKLLMLGKDFDLKSNLAGLVTVDRGKGEEDYRFKVIFDRNGLPIVTLNNL